MAATNFTPIILYHSVTASAAPTAGNLNNGELAINITDGKLFYKDNGGVVQIIATKGTGVIGGSNNQVQYNSSGALAGSANFTFDGTTATINALNLTTVLDETYGGTGLTSYTTGDVIYASGSNTLAKLAIGANTYILTSTGSVPQWSAPSAVSVSTATNLAGGTAGAVPYQSGAGATTFLSIGTNNQVLTSTGSAPQWVSGLSLTTLSTSGNTTLGDAAADNLTINATVTSNLIFTDNTYDIGANGATRPRTIYVGTSVFSPLVDATNLEVTNIKALDGTAAASIANSTGVISVVKDAIINTITVGLGAGAVSTNTAVGASALAANTTGYQNVAVGSGALAANTTEINNTAVGYRAMYSNTTGGANTALGASALNANTTGNYNIAVGVNALASNTTASYNVALGQAALQTNTTGASNTALGHQALLSNTTASNNTAVGYQAGYSNTFGSVTAVGASAGYGNTTGQYNTYVGELAGRTASTANSNTGVGYNALRFSTAGGHTAVGESALYANTTGTNSVAVGAGALQANTIGSNNTAVGYQAGYNNTTASNNTAVGFQAGYLNVTGPQLTAIGVQAGYASTAGYLTAVGFSAANNTTTGTSTVAVGASALFTNTIGSNNTALGEAALYSNTTGSNNTAVGYQAGYSNTTGSPVTFVGKGAGFSNTTGGGLVFMGFNAGYLNTTANHNIAIGGYQPLYSNTTGQYNIAIGTEALFSNTTASNNTAVGYQAGYSGTTTIDNTFLGYRAGYSATTGTGRHVFVGQSAGFSTTTGTDNVAIGYFAGYTNTTGIANVYIGSGLYGLQLPAGYYATGSKNTFVGYAAGNQITTGASNTILGSYNGNQGGLDIRIANNYIVLSDGDGNPRMFWNGANAQQSGALMVTGANRFYANSTTGGNPGYWKLGNVQLSQSRQAVIRLLGATSYSAGSAIAAVGVIQLRMDNGNNITGTWWNEGAVGSATFIDVIVNSSTGDVFARLGSYQELAVECDASDGVVWSPALTYNSAAGSPPSGTTIPYGVSFNNNSTSVSINAYGIGLTDTAVSGFGIRFPATQSASSNANTLDDYERGSWTPTYYGSTAAGTTTYTGQIGEYVKIGRLVTVSFTLGVSNATGTGDIRIGGLPFTSNNILGTVGSVMADSLTWSGDYLSSYIDGNGTVIRIYRTTAGAGLNDVGIDTSCSLYGTITYQV